MYNVVTDRYAEDITVAPTFSRGSGCEALLGARAEFTACRWRFALFV